MTARPATAARRRQVQSNRRAKSFITQETINKVIDACPDAETRAIVSLARFGELRIASEINGLKWEHILWDKNRINLPSPKTERHEGRANRMVPVVPELRPYLEDLWEPGAGFVFHTYRGRKREITRQVENAIKRAGVARWPAIFHNLRSCRQTELQENFPTHVVCAWLGNMAKVAQSSSLQVAEDHFSRALHENQIADDTHRESTDDARK